MKNAQLQRMLAATCSDSVQSSDKSPVILRLLVEKTLSRNRSTGDLKDLDITIRFLAGPRFQLKKLSTAQTELLRRKLYEYLQNSEMPAMQAIYLVEAARLSKCFWRLHSLFLANYRNQTKAAVCEAIFNQLTNFATTAKRTKALFAVADKAASYFPTKALAVTVKDWLRAVEHFRLGKKRRRTRRAR